jgi:crotonobetainyl-CoA:carnitine CoA-transferase CaiB-like acyl-CoA transferase
MRRQEMPTAFEEVMAVRGLGRPNADDVAIVGADPVLPTRFRIGETAAAVLAGVGVAISDIWELKTGRRQQASIDVRHAAAGLKSAYSLQRPDANGAFRPVVNDEHEAMRRMTQPWPTRDGRWFLPHFGLPNLRERVLKALDCEPAPDSVAKAISRRDALELEGAIDEARACGGMVRSNAEWLAHPHGQILANKPIVEIIKIGDSGPEPLPEGARPLSGIRVLDLTRILAGPMAARTLAEHGADVLLVTAERLPHIPEHVIDTSHGKRSCYLDIKDADDAARLRELIAGADIFSQGYRPGALARHGFGADEVAALRPGIIYVSISCYGADGPFTHRAGWEQLGQTVTGICHDNGAERPTLLPAAACDYTTGYLAAYGALLALARRAREGGSYHVRVSLCQSGMFIYRQGKVASADPASLTEAEVDDLRIESRTHAGPLRHLGPILKMSETPGGWERPTPKLGSSDAAWLQRAG